MEPYRIFLTYSEIEELCFSKVIEINKNRLDDEKSTKDRKYVIEQNADKQIEKEGTVTILFSSVNYFEIPEIEKNQFKNQLRIPEGLLKLVKRKIKESDSAQSSILGKDDSLEKIIFDYKIIRRGLSQLFLWGYSHDNLQDPISNFFSKMGELNMFTKSLLRELLYNKDFPSLKVTLKDGQYKNENFFKLLWLANFCKTELSEANNDSVTPEKKQHFRDWFLSFESNDINQLHKLLRDIPIQVKDYYPVIIGYLFAFKYQEFITAKNIGQKVNEVLQEIRDVDKEYEILCWSIFFQSLFEEEVDYIYPNPMLLNQFLSIEKNALFLSHTLNEDKTPSFIKYSDIKFERISEDELIKSYQKLKELNNKQEPIIISTEELPQLFSESPLFGKKKEQVALIDFQWPNQLLINQNSEIFLKLSGSYESGIYYGEINSEQKKLLAKKGLSAKLKPFSTLIPKNKRVLVFFLSHTGLPLFNLYRFLINNDHSKINKIVVVWEVNYNEEDLHTTQFAIEKDNFAKELKVNFGQGVTLFVKNKLSDSREVIRNLSVALKDYKFSQIELVDNLITDEKYHWLIEATSDYVLKLPTKNYFSFYKGL